MGLVTSTLKTMALIVGIVVAVLLSFAFFRLVMVPSIHADYWVTFWDSPAYKDFDNSAYWEESFRYTVLFWVVIASISAAIVLVGCFFDGVWCCCRTSIWKAFASSPPSLSPLPTPQYAIPGTPQPSPQSLVVINGTGDQLRATINGQEAPVMWNDQV